MMRRSCPGVDSARDRESAVDGERLAGDVARGRARKKQHGGRDLVRASRTGPSGVRASSGAVSCSKGIIGAVMPVSTTPGATAFTRMPSRRPTRPRASSSAARLRPWPRRSPGTISTAEERRHRREVDHARAAVDRAARRAVAGRARHAERAEEVDGDRLLEHVGLVLVAPAGQVLARVVDEYVEAVEARRRPRRCRPARSCGTVIRERCEVGVVLARRRLEFR